MHILQVSYKYATKTVDLPSWPTLPFLLPMNTAWNSSSKQRNLCNRNALYNGKQGAYNQCLIECVVQTKYIIQMSNHWYLEIMWARADAIMLVSSLVIASFTAYGKVVKSNSNCRYFPFWNSINFTKTSRDATPALQPTSTCKHHAKGNDQWPAALTSAVSPLEV